MGVSRPPTEKLESKESEAPTAVAEGARAHLIVSAAVSEAPTIAAPIRQRRYSGCSPKPAPVRIKEIPPLGGLVGMGAPGALSVTTWGVGDREEG